MKPNVHESLRVDRSRERGAALITALLVSTLLLIIGGALIMTTNLAAGLAIDSTSELQAYYAAEAGVNASLNVLRGNIASNPAGTRATFSNAVTDSDLSNWLTYNAAIDGVNVVELSSAPQMGYTVNVTNLDITEPGEEPGRLRIRVDGYGPNGSKKQMELVVSRFLFDFTPIATILMRGNDDGASSMDAFAIGESNAKEYSGYNNVDATQSLPVFGVTHGADYNKATQIVADSKPNTISGVDEVSQFANGDLPYFLQTADNARDFLNTLQQQAVTTNRYFTGSPADWGTAANPKFTFIDGDATLVEGAGLLVVTGTLSADGNTGFKGIILVLGKGVYERSGNGSADTLGAIVVASFERTWPTSENNLTHGFLTPVFSTTGGGTGTTRYDSDEITRALAANGLRALGVREY
ncbi:MAG TPA: pilus assembly PilX N-terminal domain-containing protein [Pyrinomonadaceae bacterium]